MNPIVIIFVITLVVDCHLPALLGQSQTGRDRFVEHANVLAMRDGTWKYIEPPPGTRRNAATNAEPGTELGGQLYDLADDLGETNDLIRAQPDRSRQLLEQLKAARQPGGLKP